MKTLFLITITLFYCAAATAQTVSDTSKYIGFEYKGVPPETLLPNGVRHLGGSMLSGVNEDPVYGISQLSKGKTWMLWLEVSTGSDQSGITGWRVLDAISVSPASGSQHVLLPLDPAIECLRSGKTVSNLVATGRIDRVRGKFTAQHAWSADLEKKKFLPISSAGLRCTYSEP